MHVVVNRVRLREPLEATVYDAAQRELSERVGAIGGIRSFYLARAGEEELLIVIVGDDEAAIDRMRDEIGNEWMTANVAPKAAAPPERLVAEVAASYERP
jgi:hypothetical protein